MWPFSQSYFLEADDEGWQLETWAFFLQHFGGIARLHRSELVTPTNVFFPPSAATGHALAEYIFEKVRRYSQLENSPCKLIPQPERPQFIGVPDGPEPMGTFSMDGEVAVITYDPRIVANPGVLVATLAHELAHYQLATLRKDLPGGEDVHEFATDLFTVFMGFGIFGTDCSFNFSSYSRGWSTSRLGYLSERAWVFALAIFLELRGQNSNGIRPFLKTYLFSDLGNARRHIAKRSLLRSIMGAD